eukprot:TRINITY_DN619_c0_g1_i2.p1 TRINITY_DN619_c0_g1~~TRINITY_DN619_c0_g1_i2.p1  ORF type:complete len:790 (-),score=241.82 TRINITY_DN619_c0_g1_i2:88-2301(-)
MYKQSNGVFVCYMRLGVGKHEYKFCVDHTNWWYDTEKPTLSDTDGNVNNVLYVTETNTQGEGQGVTSFTWTYNPGALSVQVFGEWDDWDTGTPLIHCGEDWLVTMRLATGTYQYKFNIDDEWYYDMAEPISRDETGNVNNIVVVKGLADKNVFSATSKFFEQEANDIGINIIIGDGFEDEEEEEDSSDHEKKEELKRKEEELQKVEDNLKRKEALLREREEQLKEQEEERMRDLDRRIQAAVERAEKNALAAIVAREKSIPPLGINLIQTTTESSSTTVGVHPAAAMSPRGAVPGFQSPRGVGITSAPTPRSARSSHRMVILTAEHTAEARREEARKTEQDETKKAEEAHRVAEEARIAEEARAAKMAEEARLAGEALFGETEKGGEKQKQEQEQEEEEEEESDDHEEDHNESESQPVNRGTGTPSKRQVKRVSSVGIQLRKICHACLRDNKKVAFTKKEWAKTHSRRCKGCVNARKPCRATTDEEADQVREQVETQRLQQEEEKQREQQQAHAAKEQLKIQKREQHQREEEEHNRAEEEQKAREAEATRIREEEEQREREAEAARIREEEERVRQEEEAKRIREEEQRAREAEAARIRAEEEQRARESEEARIRAEEEQRSREAEAARIRAEEEERERQEIEAVRLREDERRRNESFPNPPFPADRTATGIIAEHAQQITRKPISRNSSTGLKKCVMCNGLKGKAGFSNNQWGKPNHVRKCKDCIDAYGYQDYYYT